MNLKVSMKAGVDRAHTTGVIGNGIEVTLDGKKYYDGLVVGVSSVSTKSTVSKEGPGYMWAEDVVCN